MFEFRLFYNLELMFFILYFLFLFDNNVYWIGDVNEVIIDLKN